MKKYLKKALSALIALAVAGSMIPASFAAKVELTDIAGTTYETAIKTLVSLGIIDGFAEDSTFRPDELITREQTAKVVVAALNQIESAEAMAGKTEFSDVAADRWSSGYVNAGVQEGFINGMGDGTFAPTENVTFAQMVKMLVSVLGYDAHADYMGGWPNGFVSIAKTEGVADGVKANNNDQVTRGQVAQLVYNALNTPIVKEGALKFDSKGEPYAELTIMNGEDSNYYKTLLTEKFDAFTVEGKIAGSYRTGDTDEPGLIDFEVAETEDYDSDIFGEAAITADNALVDIDVNGTDAESYVGTYGKAIIIANDYNELTLLDFAPSGKNKTVELDASLLDVSAWDADEDGVVDAGITVIDTDASDDNDIGATTKAVDSLDFYATASATKSTEYDLAVVKTAGVQTGLGVTLYVNGVKMNTSNIATDIVTYVLKNTNGTIKLVDTYGDNVKGYDTIYVSYYATVEVDSANAKTGKIAFNSTNKINANKNSIVLDDEDETLVYTITLNGEKVDISAIEEEDILTVAYDVTGDFDASKFYDIYVSRDVQTGALGSLSSNGKTVKIGGVEYAFVADSINTLNKTNINDEYTIYNDYFGRIFKFELNTSAAKYAIIDKISYSTSNEVYSALLYTVDGTQKTYVIDDTKVTISTAFGDVYSASNTTNGYYVGTTRKAVKDRVVSYKLSTSTGKITDLTVLSPNGNSIKNPLGVGDANKYYTWNEAKQKIGTIKASDATKVFDADKYADSGDVKNYNKIGSLSVSDLSVLVDDRCYEAYSYGAALTDGTDPIILVTYNGSGVYTENTRFAVITGASVSTGIDEETNVTVHEIDALYEGVETTLKISDDISSVTLAALTRGDVVLVKEVDANGFITDLDTIFRADNLSTQTTFIADALEASTADGAYAYTNIAITLASPYQGWYTADKEAMQIVFGPVVDKSTSDFSIGTVAGTGSDIYTNLDAELDGTVNGAVIDVDYSTDTNVYLYNYGTDAVSRRFETDASIVASTVKTTEVSTSDYIYWSKNADDENDHVDNIVFALALVVDGEAVDVLTFAKQ